ncbi:MAG: hypothetical protein JXA38_04090 [Methanosarcinaceae archaeon]|nr:hypothetical protein [Methanosarcinaceae archaeon]
MSLISDERAGLFGLFLFFVLMIFALTVYAVEKPVIDELDAAFDDDYRDAYLTTEGKETADMLKYILESVFVIGVLIAGVIMVINRSIYKGRDSNG